jgi:predicted O-methyltransferase YrrM
VEILFVAINAFVLLAIVVSYHKLSKALDQHKKRTAVEIGNIYQQVEALIGIYAEVNMGRALPQMRGWAGSPDFLRNLLLLVREKKPSVVLECSSGVSTVILARALQLNGSGHVYSLEHDPIFAERTRDILRRFDLDDIATVFTAPFIDTRLPGWEGKWYSTSSLGRTKVDLLVVDGPPQATSTLARYPAVPVLMERMSATAVIVADDTDREDDAIAVSRWLQEYRELRRVEVPQCEKGWAVLQRFCE